MGFEYEAGMIDGYIAGHSASTHASDATAKATQAIIASENAIDTTYVSLDYMDRDTTRHAVYLGTSISPDGQTVLTDGNGPQKYFIENDGIFEEVDPVFAIAAGENDGAKLIEQLNVAMGKQYTFSDQIVSDFARGHTVVEANRRNFMNKIDRHSA